VCPHSGSSITEVEPSEAEVLFLLSIDEFAGFEGLEAVQLVDQLADLRVRHPAHLVSLEDLHYFFVEDNIVCLLDVLSLACLRRAREPRASA